MENFEDLNVEKKSVDGNYKFLGVNITYLVCAILFLTIGALFQNMHVESGLIITEYLLILAPVFLVGFIMKVDFKSALRLNKISLKHILLIMLMALVLIPVIFASNLLMVVLLNTFDKMSVQSIPSASNGSELALYLFIISISAGICEEFFFRGMVLNAYEKYFNRNVGIVLSAILFGIFHYNLQNLFGPIILGLVFGYLVTVTGSIWAGVIAHATNNGVAVVSSFLMEMLSPSTIEAASSEATQASLEALKFPTVIPILIVVFVFAGIGLFIAVKIIKYIGRDFLTYEVNQRVKIGKNLYRISDMDEETIGILSEAYYDDEREEAEITGDLEIRKNIKIIQLDRFKRYKVKIMAPKASVDRSDLPTVTGTVAKMLPIIISIIIYAFIWIRYLGRV